jgi:hypothetical protein
MTEQQSQEDEAPTQVEKPEIMTAEMFMAADFEAPLVGLTTSMTFELSNAFYKAATDAKNAGDEAKTKIYALLGSVLGIMLRATDRGSPWGSQWAMTDGTRSLLPSDIVDQTEQFVPLLQITKNLLLKARMADMIWSNDKSQVAAAKTAVECYSAIVLQLLNGTLHSYGDTLSDQHEALHVLQRGAAIASAISKKDALPDCIVTAAKALYEAARDKNGYVACAEAAELGCRLKIFDEATVAKELEAMVDFATPDIVPDAVRRASDFAVYLYGTLKDENGKERCQLHSVRLILAMSEGCTQAGAKASWVMDAIQALGKMKGYQALIADMKKVLRELQEASTQEYATFSVPLNIENDREDTHQQFLGFDLSDALKNFALLSHSPPKDKLRQEATDCSGSSPMLSMMSMHHTDGDGKVINKTDGARPGETPSEDWYDTTINRAESLRHQIVVGAGIDPARLAINQKFSIIEEHLAPIVAATWVVSQSQKPLLILGFTRFLQGDFMSAAHLIIPQLEPCLRNILQINGVDTAKRRDNSTEEDRDLGALFRYHRPALERILGVDLTYELELVFDRKGGDRLRHLVAHGNLTAGGCFSADVIYASWLIYRLCCLPVLKAGWDQIVRPRI